jgi:stage IV sporulation protein FB
MFAVEPPPSQGDLHFRVFGFPVRVSPWFWGVTLMMALSGGEKGSDPKDVLIWVAVVFVSILIHELGHAVLQRRFGGRPRIVLYGFGGLAVCDDCDRSPRTQILISLAGPCAGFLFAAAILVMIRLAGHEVRFGALPGLVGKLIPLWEPFESPLANGMIFYLLYVNIFWGLVNLLPIYPLDGGRVSRELFTLNHPRRGIVQSLWLSAVVAGAFAIFGLMRGSIFTAIMFGYLAYANYQNIQAYDRHWD